MRILKITVGHFGCIRSARVELGTRLNVLYGPNDLGKSSLLSAVRAALLLPHSSSARDPYVPWEGDHTPSVELVFTTDPKHFYRLTKTFGSGSRGSSELAESPDGLNFVPRVQARQVDGELRKLLRWGIPGPGGAGRIKGLPSTFLTSALIADQAEVTAVLQQSLTKDYDESGRERITEALEALAQDPLFQHALEHAAQKVGEAFTATGQRSRKKTAPFFLSRDRINKAREDRDALREQLEKSEAVADQVRFRAQERLDREAELQEATTKLKSLEQDWNRVVALAAADARLADAELTVREAKATLQAVASTETELVALRKAIEEANETLGEKKKGLEDARSKHEQAKDRLTRLRSEEGAAQRKLKQQDLEKKRLQLEAQAKEATQRAEVAKAAGKLVERVSKREAELQEEEGQLAERRIALASRATQLDEASRAHARNGELELWFSYCQAKKELTAAEGKAAREKELRDEALGKQSAAAEKLARLNESPLPSRDKLRALRDLREKLRIAEGRLEVGLSVTIRPKQSDLQVLARVDGAEEESLAVAAEKTLLASARVLLDIPDVAELEVVGGSEAAQAEARELTQRWEAEGKPVLSAAGVADLEELEAKVRGAEEETREAERLTREAAGLLKQADAVGDTAAAISEAKARLASEESRLPSPRDEQVLAEELAALGSQPLDRLRATRRTLESRLAEVKKEQDNEQLAIARSETSLASGREELKQEQAARDAALADVEGADWAQVVSESMTVASAATEAIAATGVEIESLLKEQDAAVSEAELAVEQALGIVQATQGAVAEAEQARDKAQAALGKCEGQLEERRQAAERVDLVALETLLQGEKDKRAQLQPPSQPVDEETCLLERRKVEALQGEFEQLVADLRKLEGALEQVGGEPLREAFRDAEAALKQAEDHEAELEIEYGGWKLLHETLRSVEHDHGTHLGQALLEPVSQRFQELTDSRYGNLSVGAHLDTRGLVAAGSERAIEVLSVGTREQLATVFRLCVAEQLGSVLLLDDQLVQSDTQRMGWFREVLRDYAKRIQIIVITCRPEDYVDAKEMPGSSRTFQEDPAGLVRTVDLSRLIDRFPFVAAAQSPDAP